MMGFWEWTIAMLPQHSIYWGLSSSGKRRNSILLKFLYFILVLVGGVYLYVGYRFAELGGGNLAGLLVQILGYILWLNSLVFIVVFIAIVVLKDKEQKNKQV